MKNVFADVSALAARNVSPLSIGYNDVALDTKPATSAYLNNLDAGYNYSAPGVHI